VSVVKWVLIVIALIVILIIIFLFSKLKVLIHINHSQDDDNIKIKLSTWFGLLRYTIKIPMVKIDDETASIDIKHKESSNVGKKAKPKKEKKFTAKEILNSIKDMQSFIEHVVGLHKIVKKFLRKVHITQLDWQTILGIGDAAHTGILVGVGWTVKGCLLGVINQYIRLEVQPNIAIIPSFQRAYSETKLVCIFHFRIGHAMFAGIRLVKFWKGGKPKFRTAPLSILSKEKSKEPVKS
jgi:hypothetical protein